MHTSDYHVHQGCEHGILFLLCYGSSGRPAKKSWSRLALIFNLFAPKTWPNLFQSSPKTVYKAQVTHSTRYTGIVNAWESFANVWMILVITQSKFSSGVVSKIAATWPSVFQSSAIILSLSKRMWWGCSKLGTILGPCSFGIINFWGDSLTASSSIHQKAGARIIVYNISKFRGCGKEWQGQPWSLEHSLQAKPPKGHG